MITRKIQLYPVGDEKEVDRVYTYLRDSIKSQNKAMNQYMSNLYVEELLNASKEDRKELNALYTRIPTSKKGSAYSLDLEFQKGQMLGYITRTIDSDFKKSLKDGLMYGKVSLPVYSNSNPLLVHVNYCNLRSKVQKQTGTNTGIYHNYESHQEFLSHLYKTDIEIYLQFANNILFKLNLGDSIRKSHEIRSVIQKIFEEEYTIHGSQIQLKKRKTGKGEDIFLLLSIETPVVKHELDENIVVGVDLGVANPAVCAVNINGNYKFLGDGETFLHYKQKSKAERRRLQRALKYTNGGHGRTKKLKALDRLKERESNFTTTYSHKLSKAIVDFAIEQHAKYINLEDLTGIDDKDGKKLLDCWKYYELQQFIIYKAAHHGIIVRFINPKYTSQTCSKCGNHTEGQRDGHSFTCKACGEKLDADLNAARNIAMSTNFVERGKKKKKKNKNDNK